MHIDKKLSLLICGVLVSFSAFASSSTDKLYRLAFSISQDGKPLASPEVVVREGVTGSVETSSSNGIKLDFTVTDLGDNKLEIAVRVASPRGSSSPSIVVRQGQPGSISDGNIELQVTADRHDS